MTGPQLPGVAALEVARQYIGTKESPSGSNRTAFGEWFGVDGVPWCAIFVSYCFARGAGVILCADFDGPGVHAGKGCAYVPTVMAWAKARGFWLGHDEVAVPGDLVIYDWEGDGRTDHIGIVDLPPGSARFMAVEGNTGEGNDSNGGEVMYRARNVRHVAGFVRVR